MTGKMTPYIITMVGKHKGDGKSWWNNNYVIGKKFENDESGERCCFSKMFEWIFENLEIVDWEAANLRKSRK